MGAPPRAQNLGTPALNPPPPGDVKSLADTPQALDNYDVLIGGCGFLVYRDHDDNKPTEVYDTEPIDYTYSPVFIERTSVSGDLGDNTQDFYMQFTQNDWSGGIGQRYFKQQPPRDSMYWDGKGVQTAAMPGQVRLGWNESTQALSGGQTMANYLLLYRRDETPNYPGIPKGMMLKFEGNASTTTTYQWSVDGGVSWNTQATSNNFIATDLCDGVIGDDGFVYVLEGNSSGTTSIVHRIAGPNSATIAWDNSTKFVGGSTPQANCITYWSGNIYVAGTGGALKQVAFGTSGTQTLVKDLGGGHILQLLSTPAGVYIYYAHNDGTYRCYLYNGQQVSEVVRLPNGWRSHFTAEFQQIQISSTASLEPNCIHAMAYQDGVLYVAGMIPARDYQQSARDQAPMRTALWFYSAGNSGLVWSSEVMSHSWLETGGGGACCSINSGGIVFLDMTDMRLMLYDPASGSISTVGTVTNTNSSFASGFTVTGTVNSLATSFVCSSPSLYIGDIIQCNGTSEKILVTGNTGTTTGTYSIVRGYLNTTPSNTTLVNAKTLTVTRPLEPAGQLIYDIDNSVVFARWNAQMGDSGTGGHYANMINSWQVRPGPDYGGAVSGTLVSSQFDMNSSLQKYFRSALWDGDLAQFPNLTTETAGTVDLYYKLDGTANATTDTGVVLLQAGATPGTSYDIRATGRSVCILAVLNAPAGTGAKPISQGPIIRRVAVKGAPMLPGYRLRRYQIAMFDNMQLKNGTYEPNTPAQLRETLETMILASAPVSVSDNTVTNMVMAFEPDQCKIREVRANEYVGYIWMREV